MLHTGTFVITCLANCTLLLIDRQESANLNPRPSFYSAAGTGLSSFRNQSLFSFSIWVYICISNQLVRSQRWLSQLSRVFV
jgi:hypothetical protein